MYLKAKSKTNQTGAIKLLRRYSIRLPSHSPLNNSNTSHLIIHLRAPWCIFFFVRAPPFHMHGTQSVCGESVKIHFLPKAFPTPPTKDKSISRQMVLKDAGAACLRWEASNGSKQLSSRMLVWVIPRCHTQRDTHIRVSPESLSPISDARCHKKAAYGRFAGKREKNDAERGGRKSEYFIFVSSNWIVY